MAHTTASKEKLLARARRIRGQLGAIEEALEVEHECSEVLQLIAATRSAINELMNEMVEGHIRHHVLNTKATADERKSADELIDIVRTHFK